MSNFFFFFHSSNRFFAQQYCKHNMASLQEYETLIKTMVETQQKILDTQQKILETQQMMMKMQGNLSERSTQSSARPDLNMRWKQFQVLLKRLPKLYDQAYICMKIAHPEWSDATTSHVETLEVGRELFPDRSEIEYKANEEYGAIYRQAIRDFQEWRIQKYSKSESEDEDTVSEPE